MSGTRVVFSAVAFLQFALRVMCVSADVSEIPVVCRLPRMISPMLPPEGAPDNAAAEFATVSSGRPFAPLKFVEWHRTTESVALEPMAVPALDAAIEVGRFAEGNVLACDLPAITWKIAPTGIMEARAGGVRLVPSVKPSGVDTGYLATAALQMIYRGLQDGTLSPRQPRWRPYLLKMLVEGTAQTQFDTVFTCLLSSFPGSDGATKLARMRHWVEGLDARSAGDVWRAETRYWINAGEYERAVEAADRMMKTRPDYSMRAFRLKALAHASAGRLEEARMNMQSARRLSLPSTEKAELLYLEAWIELQDGNVGKAKKSLKAIFEQFPSTSAARKARKVMDSLMEGQ